LVFLIGAINNGEKEFESILWKLNNDGFTYAIADVFDDEVQETCDNCSGNGTLDCEYCDGKGDTDCETCDGSGDVECDNCNGSGEDEEGETCGNCDGSGNLNCDDCNGSGNESCGHCDGSGDETCQECGGSGEQKKYEAYELKLSIYFSINEELKLELSKLKRYNEIDSDTITDYEVTNETMLVYNLPISIEVETDANLQYNTEYFYDVDNGGWVGGTADRPNFDLDY
jgi:DnaJ-class molecular chaperone